MAEGCKERIAARTDKTASGIKQTEGVIKRKRGGSGGPCERIIISVLQQ